MARSLNQCNFIGRVGQPIDLRYMPNGNAVANFSIACSDDYKDKQTGQKVERTNWVRIVAFGSLAETCGKWLDKGSQVFISGKLTERKWQDQSGQDRYTTEIVANDMQMLGGNSSANAGQQSGQNSAPPPDFDDSLGF